MLKTTFSKCYGGFFVLVWFSDISILIDSSSPSSLLLELSPLPVNNFYELGRYIKLNSVKRIRDIKMLLVLALKDKLDAQQMEE